MKAELFEVIKTRSRMNNRSLSQEIIFLLETAIAMQSESTRDMIHLLYKMSDQSDSADD